MQKSDSRKRKPRTLKTYTNKINKLKAKYNKLVKTSKQGFRDKYPSFTSWAAMFPMRQLGKETR